MFDINSFAREYFLEANSNILRDSKWGMRLMDDMHVIVEETTLSGSIERYAFRNASIPRNMFLNHKTN